MLPAKTVFSFRFTARVFELLESRAVSQTSCNKKHMLEAYWVGSAEGFVTSPFFT
jgi:hypothetical protein